jgi:hypothetical protein
LAASWPVSWIYGPSRWGESWAQRGPLRAKWTYLIISHWFQLLPEEYIFLKFQLGTRCSNCFVQFPSQHSAMMPHCFRALARGLTLGFPTNGIWLSTYIGRKRKTI